MRNLRRITAALIVAASTLLSPAPAHAGWSSWYKPDLVAAQVVPYTNTKVKVLIANTKSVGSSGFSVIVRTLTGSVYGYAYVPGLGAYQATSVVVELNGKYTWPGTFIEARVDLFDSVAETNESNNVCYYYSPVK